MNWKIMLLLASLLLTACASSVDPETGETTARARTPTGGLLRGELSPDEYFGAITKANEKDREEQQFLLNREPTRAYNIKTGRIEYVPEGTTQKWNEEHQRWEFTPIN